MNGIRVASFHRGEERFVVRFMGRCEVNRINGAIDPHGRERREGKIVVC